MRVLVSPLIVAAALAALPAAPAPVPVALQPLAATVRRLEVALAYLGQPLPAPDHEAIAAALAVRDEAEAAAALQRVLDRHVLLEVHINPESRVKVAQGAATPELLEEGTRLFLVKVINEAGVRRRSSCRAPRAVPPRSRRGTATDRPSRRWCCRRPWPGRNGRTSRSTTSPRSPRALSGLAVEYRILEIYSRDRGQRAAEIRVRRGAGQPGHRLAERRVVLFDRGAWSRRHVPGRDEKDRPAIAAFTIRDRAGRVYPLRAKRLAPDLPFQSHIYRGDGENITLPAGTYVWYSAGPEYLPGRADTRRHRARRRRSRREAAPLDRSVGVGWYSGDHHVHAAGCAHYQARRRASTPTDMMRPSWAKTSTSAACSRGGPCWYHQKQFFRARDDPLSPPDHLMRYDVEVSGFPSSHAGHLVLLRLKEDDYPGTTRIEEWPSWDLPILQWGAHSRAASSASRTAAGACEVKSRRRCPTYEMPAVRRHRRQRVHRRRGARRRGLHLRGRYAGPVGAEHLVSHAQLRLPDAHQRRDRLPLHLRRARRPGPHVRELDRLTYRGWLEAVQGGRTYVSDGLRT